MHLQNAPNALATWKPKGIRSKKGQELGQCCWMGRACWNVLSCPCPSVSTFLGPDPEWLAHHHCVDTAKG